MQKYIEEIDIIARKGLAKRILSVIINRRTDRVKGECDDNSHSYINFSSLFLEIAA